MTKAPYKYLKYPSYVIKNKTVRKIYKNIDDTMGFIHNNEELISGVESCEGGKVW